MIYYDRKYALETILNSWQKRNLEIVGIYEFTVIDKQAVKLYKQSTQSFLLYVHSHGESYETMMEVNLDTFKKARVGESIGRRTLLRHKYKRDYLIVAESDDPKEALKQVSKQGKFKLIILLFIIFLIISSIILLIIPIVYK